jgi:hypothetical protein
MTDSGLNPWTEGLSSRERVREIAMTLTQPRSVDWVRAEAQVSSWQTAKDELEMLVEFRQVHAIEGDDGNTKYAPNYQLRYFNELTELINERSQADLREEIASIQETIEDWMADYGVDSRDDLEATLTDESLSSEDVRERNRVLRRWERCEDNKRLLKHALELYDDAQSLYPGQNESSSSSAPLSR